ncbi:MBL fold metallo-hydrolase [Halorientalis brevis]|uniref:MBL fold metallo-hydrolase n=1 Tax=Halorientalis brevis TaxID=1126241 RepID=A0ABD6C6T1_9EURY|nr:MBL fold metallo-hydrolase [Halorientalis brevis]
MAIGDCFAVTEGSCSDLYYVDTGMYDAPEYGSVYIVDGERPALVDSGIGTEYERILAAMDDVGIAPDDLAVIALTHVHLDHAGGAGFLAAECPNATVAIHEIGAPHLADPSRLVEGTKAAVGDLWGLYAEPEPVPEDRIRELSDGDVIDLGDRELHVHHAPGHAPHQVVFEDPADAVVFTADAAGIYVPSGDFVHHTSPPPNFDLEQVLADANMIEDLAPEVLCYGHFGPATTDDRLREYADVIADWVDRIATKRAELGDDEAVIDYFAEQTEMVDVWGDRKARGEERMNVRGVLTYLDHRESADE